MPLNITQPLKRRKLQYATQMNPAHLTPSEVSQSQKGKYHMIPFIKASKIVKFKESKGRIVGAGAGRMGKRGGITQWVYSCR